mgnify:CR=1 FL=1|tara:strand:+ start:3724 stop:4158 length:435 start_codon:yes stop_codon:yes gene_type:complete
MNISIFGYNINVFNAIIFMILGALISSHTVCGCMKVTAKEAMTNLKNAALLDDNNQSDIKDSWINKSYGYAANMGNKTHLEKNANVKGTHVPLEDTMVYFKDNEFKPSCCPATYSTSTGCACSSSGQVKYLNERGGNRTLPTEF